MRHAHCCPRQYRRQRTIYEATSHFCLLLMYNAELATGQRQNNEVHVREQLNNGTPVRNKTHGYMRKQYNNAQACQFVLTTLVNPRQ